MATAAKVETSKDATAMERLWALACVLAQQQRVNEALKCLELVINAKDLPVQTQLHSQILLAELCAIVCTNEKKAEDQELYLRRVQRAEKCVNAVEAALEDDKAIEKTWRPHFIKAKYLLIKLARIDRPVKNKRMLELLCEGIYWCSESSNGIENLSEMKKYFCIQLKVCILKMYAASIKGEYVEQERYTDNLKLIRSSLRNHIDVDQYFQLWLVEVTCHALTTAFEPGNYQRASDAMNIADQVLNNLTSADGFPNDLRVYHLVISAFYQLRTGEIQKLGPLLDEINVIRDSNEVLKSSLLKEPYMDSILDAIRLKFVSSYDPCEAMKMTIKAIHLVQENIQKYSAHAALDVMLIAAMFDMLYMHCQLQAQQCRYFDLGLSLTNMVSLFDTYKSHLEQTAMYKFILARCHILVAKYAVAIGRVKDACFHLNLVRDKLLPPVEPNETSYPDIYLSLWVDMLEVVTYFNGITDESFKIHPNGSQSIEVVQIYPDVVLVKYATRILEIANLRLLIHNGCSLELCQKYDLALAKWIWATSNLKCIAKSLKIPASLEQFRSKSMSLLHKCLDSVNAHGKCIETTGEIMALFGPELVKERKIDAGDEVLKNAAKLSLHAKNVLLQARIFVELFHIYDRKQLVQARATVAEQYERRVATMKRRIAQAQAEEATNKAILRWTCEATK